MSFMGGMGGALGESIGRSSSLPEPTARRVAISAGAGSAMIVKLDSADAAGNLRSVLTSANVPKAVHDYKAAIHALDPLGISLAGVRHDSMLYSYLLDPTWSSHRLADVALRRFNLKLAGDLAESADIAGRIAVTLRGEVEQAGLAKLYEEMDLPLVPVLARMEQAGVKIDTAALSQMSGELEREIVPNFVARIGYAGSKGTNLDHIGFDVKDHAAFVKKISDEGIKLDEPVRTAPNGSIITYITDPWGTRIELIQRE